MTSTIAKTTIHLIVKVSIIVFSLLVIITLGKLYIDYKVADLKKEIARQQDFSPTAQQKLKDLECLSINIYWEAGNQIGRAHV